MTILVVDDEQLIRLTLSRALSKKNHTIHAASNGVEALKILDESKIDLIVLDLLMPEKNGFDVMKEMKSHIPVIVISAFSGPMENEIRDDIYPQIIGFVKKPFEHINTLIEYIEGQYENYSRKI